MAANKGNYYRRKTKAWLEAKGYTVEYMEHYQRIFKAGKVILIKKDLFASDVLAINDKEIIFANSILGRKNIASHIKGYLAYEFPDIPQVKRWIIVWEERARGEPEIIDIADIKQEEVKDA